MQWRWCHSSRCNGWINWFGSFLWWRWLLFGRLILWRGRQVDNIICIGIICNCIVCGTPAFAPRSHASPSCSQGGLYLILRDSVFGGMVLTVGFQLGFAFLPLWNSGGHVMCIKRFRVRYFRWLRAKGGVHDGSASLLLRWQLAFFLSIIRSFVDGCWMEVALVGCWLLIVEGRWYDRFAGFQRSRYFHQGKLALQLER